MARSPARSARKVSGGRYRPFRTKRKYELAGYPANTKLETQTKVTTKRMLGGHFKQTLLTTKAINVSDSKGKVTMTEIVNVVENPANPNLVRRNIITKGAVVETKLGKMRVTSRPGQEGALYGVVVG